MKHRFISTLTAVAAALCTVFTATGCSAENKNDNGKLSIVTTCFPPYDFARAVTGDTADITMLLCPGAEAHSYEPTPLDIVTIQQCDVFIYVGGSGEVWVEKVLDTVGNENMTVIKLMDYVEPLEEEVVAGASPNGHSHHHHHHEEEENEETDSHDEDTDDHDEDSHEDEHGHSDEGHYDEHIWTSPKNAQLCTDGVYDALVNAYPTYADTFRENAEAYTDKLHSLDEKFTEMTADAPENVIVVGDRFPFRYLADDYGLEYFAAFSGCSSESEPGVYTMAFLIDEIKAHDIDNIFYLEFSTKRLAEKLSNATGADMLPLHSCNNVSQDDFNSGITYIELMEQNYNNLREALY